MYAKIISVIANRFPEVIPHLKGRARWIAFATYPNNDLYLKFGWATGIDINANTKTVEFFERTLTRLITSVYNAQISSEFLDIAANLISGQLRQAVEQAWSDEGGDGAIPGYLQALVMEATVNQFIYVDRLYLDIVNARELEQPLAPILSRVSLWTQRWTETYNRAVALIVQARGGNLIWRLGATEQHCVTCANLNGIVAGASEWAALGCHPQGAPNALLECGGWRCDCTLKPTKAKRTERAYDIILGVIG